MRKKSIIKILIISLVIAWSVMLLNAQVTYRQGVNFKVSVIKIPLYLKILDFFDRHYNYKNLVNKIIKKSDSPKERVMKIFDWTYNNIKRAPAGYPIVDDHVWHIIVRGYGTDDQYQDVFTTLCNYAGVDAFFDFIYSNDNAKIMPLSFVRLDKEWLVFDAYNGIYFKSEPGKINDNGKTNKIEWRFFGIGKKDGPIQDYTSFLENLPVFEKIGLKRANIQSPLKRFIYEVEKWVRK